MTKKDRKLLIEALSTGLALYVPVENRKDLVELIADKLEVNFKSHFVEACLTPY